MKNHLFRPFPAALGLLVLTLGLILPTSCTKEVFRDFEDDELVEMTITVGGNTKTENDGNGTVWKEGDDLTVIHSATSASSPSFWPSQFLFSGENAFHGTVSRLSATNNWYAVYPYAESNASANDIVFTLPSTQTQEGNGNASMAHLAGRNFPLFGKAEGIARSTELNLPMKNLLAVAKFNVTNNTDADITIKEIEYTASSPIAGTFSVDLTGESPVFNSGTVKTVKLNVNGGASIAAGATAVFYMAIAPYEAAAGTVRQVKVVATDDTPCYRTFNTAVTFKSGVIKNIDFAYDKNSQNPEINNSGTAGEVELEVGEEPEDGEYLLVYVDESGNNSSMAFAAFTDKKQDKYAIPVSVADGYVYSESIDLSDYVVSIEVAKDEAGNPIHHSNNSEHFAYNVKNKDGKYVFYSTGGGTIDASDALQIKDTNEMQITQNNTTTTYKYYHTFVQEEDGVQIMSSIAGANGGNTYLLAYTSKNGFYYEQDNTGQKLHLFRLGGSVKEKQYPAFRAERVEYDFDASGPGVLTDAPTLTGAKTHVSYNSSNESVASVDDEGNVTVHKAGTATITATAEADDVYYSATASYLVVSTTSAGTTFYRVTEFTAGEQYLIISAGKALANNSGSISATDVSASGDEIIVSDAASMMWTATASGSGFTLSNNGYYVQRASGQGGGKPSISNSPNTSYYVWAYSNNRLSTASGSTYYLYYSSGWSQTSSSSSAGSVTIYSSTKPLTKQTLNFAQASVAWVIGEGYELNGSYAFPQTVTGNVTPVTYTSSNTSIATISGNGITIVATGSTTIKARTEGNNEYAPAEASYTLRINNKAPDGFISLGTINLENSSVKNYLDNGTNDYTDDNYSGTTNVAQYAPGNNSPRVDIPNPVSLDWGTASSGTATITVYNDQALSDEVWTWTATKGSTSYNIYNLIPGQTYYCTVVDDANNNYLYKATFNTEGRRRMIKVSDTQSANNANNCRDLGGMITKDGKKRIKYGMIYRGTNLTSTTAAEKKLLAEFMNIGLDNDLRDGSGGGSSRDNPFQNTNYSVAYCGPGYTTTISEWPSGPYTETGVNTGSGSGYGWDNGNANYLTNPVRAYQTMQAFIDAAKRGKASYFHCYIGSDRTGYWGLVIEGLLGVSAKDCSIDFELTSFANKVTSGNRTRNSGTYANGMDFFKKKSYYSTYANDVNHQLQNTITHYFVNEVGQYIVDHRSEILKVYEDSAAEYQLFQNFTIDGFAADIETFKSLLLEDI